MRARRPLRVIIAACATATGAVMAQAIPASAHITIGTYGTTFTAGATNVIYFRVPHGCPDDLTTYDFNAQTTKVVVTIPAGATGVKPEKKPGWSVSVVRDITTLAVTEVTWETTTDALPDWTYADFGLRATLNGVAGTVLEFPTTQYCSLHDDGSPVFPDPDLFEAWTGVNVPKLTLVGTASKVANAADLANLKDRVVALETSVSGALTSIAGLLNTDTSLDARITALETQLSSISSTNPSAINFLPTPLRSYDSRDNAGAKIAALETRTISLANGKDGNGVSTAAVPAGATAAVVTLTVTETNGPGGFLKLYGAASAEPATSSINWSGSDQNLSVSTLVAVDATGQVKVTGGANSTHFVIDVIGYVN